MEKCFNNKYFKTNICFNEATLKQNKDTALEKDSKMRGSSEKYLEMRDCGKQPRPVSVRHPQSECSLRLAALVSPHFCHGGPSAPPVSWPVLRPQSSGCESWVRRLWRQQSSRSDRERLSLGGTAVWPGLGYTSTSGGRREMGSWYVNTTAQA